MSAILVVFVIPSEVEESLIYSKVTARDVSTPLDMTTADPFLLHRCRRDDLNAFDHDAVRRLAHFAHAVVRHRRVADFVEHIIAFDQFAKGCVLPIESPNRCQTDKKVLAGRIWIRATRHRDDTPIMGMIVKFGFDFVSWPTLPVSALFRRIFRIRVAPLDHESFDDSMKGGAIV